MRLRIPWASVATLCALAGQGANAAVTLDLTSDDSIKTAAKTIAKDLMSFYTGNNPGDTPGNLPDPYYWWEAGAMFGTMVNYWFLTGDTTYNDITSQALLHQAGDDGDFMPLNQTKTLGNDDQGFWGMSAMMAAEMNFQNPPADEFQWLALAQGVFNTQVVRYDTSTCNGGFRWQIFTFNSGYNYKNSISNGVFFNLASRLALYTGNDTYAQWADKTWEWVQGVGLMSETYEVFDGTQNEDNCTSKDHNQWTYNAGIYMHGAAAMYNYTNGSAIWQERVQGLLNNSGIFFTNSIMHEVCEASTKGCNVDQRSFKAYFSRWLGGVIKFAPFTSSQIMPLLQSSATAAAKTCTGGTGNQCGLIWGSGTFDGSIGVGEQMAALEVVQANLISKAPDYASTVRGTGTSTGNAEAGGSSSKTSNPSDLATTAITSSDRAGAGILTALILASVVGGSVMMILP